MQQWDNLSLSDATRFSSWVPFNDEEHPRSYWLEGVEAVGGRGLAFSPSPPGQLITCTEDSFNFSQPFSQPQFSRTIRQLPSSCSTGNVSLSNKPLIIITPQITFLWDNNTCASNSLIVHWIFNCYPESMVYNRRIMIFQLSLAVELTIVRTKNVKRQKENKS